MNKIILIHITLLFIPLSISLAAVCEDIKQQTNEREKEISDIDKTISGENLAKLQENKNLTINPGIGVGSCKIGESIKGLIESKTHSKSNDAEEITDEDGEDEPKIEQNIPNELKSFLKVKGKSSKFYNWASRDFYFLVGEDGDKIQVIIIKNPSFSIKDKNIRVGDEFKKEYSEIKGLTIIPTLDKKRIWAIAIP